MEGWAIPSSPHADGRAARALLEEARATIAEVLDWRHDVILTSGASEAIADRRGAGEGPRRRIVGATEHDAVVAAMGAVARIFRSRRDGLDRSRCAGAFWPTGRHSSRSSRSTTRPASSSRSSGSQEMVRERGSLLLADCAQSGGQDCRCPTRISLRSRLTSSAARRGSARCWSEISRPRGESAGRSGDIGAGPRIVPAVAGMAAALEAAAFRRDAASRDAADAA